MWCLLWVSVTDFFSFMLIVALAGDENECPPVHMTVANKTVAWFSEINEWDVFSKSRLVGLVLIRVYLVGPGPVWWSVDILLTNRQNIFHMIITYFNKSQQITLLTKLKEFLITKKNLKHFDTCNCKKSQSLRELDNWRDNFQLSRNFVMLTNYWK